MTANVSAVIVNYNSNAHLSQCLGALSAERDDLEQIVVVDNASLDGSLERAIADHPSIQIIRNYQNFGPGVARNQGARITRSDFVLFVDPDVIIPVGAVKRMRSELGNGPGVVAPALLSAAHGRVEFGGTADLVGFPVPLPRPGPALYVPAAAMMTPRECFEELGGFDERFFWGEELDYCWRVLLAGGEVTVLPDVVAEHACGVSTPGGYARDGRLETTAFRVLNRERAALATLLKCVPAVQLTLTVPSFVGYTLALALGALVSGRRDISAGLLSGLVWNAHEARTTFKQRRSIRRSRRAERVAASRLYRGIYPLRLLMAHGAPRFVDHAQAGPTRFRSPIQY